MTWLCFQGILNFTFTCVDTIDGNWGTLEEDGSWNGMVGMLAMKQVDIGSN